MPLPWLILLSEPEGLKLSMPPRALGRAALSRLLDVAQGHGVLPATVSNLSAAAARGCAQLVASGGKEDIDSILAAKKGRLRAGMVLSLLLRQQGNDVMKALSEKSIPAFILKGAHFADRLIGLKGVQHGRLVMTVPAHAIEHPHQNGHKHSHKL